MAWYENFYGEKAKRGAAAGTAVKPGWGSAIGYGIGVAEGFLDDWFGSEEEAPRPPPPSSIIDPGGYQTAGEYWRRPGERPAGMEDPGPPPEVISPDDPRLAGQPQYVVDAAVNRSRAAYGEWANRRAAYDEAVESGGQGTMWSGMADALMSQQPGMGYSAGLRPDQARSLEMLRAAAENPQIARMAAQRQLEQAQHAIAGQAAAGPYSPAAQRAAIYAQGQAGADVAGRAAIAAAQEKQQAQMAYAQGINRARAAEIAQQQADTAGYGAYTQRGGLVRDFYGLGEQGRQFDTTMRFRSDAARSEEAMKKWMAEQGHDIAWEELGMKREAAEAAREAQYMSMAMNKWGGGGGGGSGGGGTPSNPG